MRTLRAPALTLLLVTAALAGCFGAEEPPAPAAPDEALPADTTDLTVDDGTTEMPADLGHMPHLHDYWMGKERITIMDDEIVVDEFNTLGFTFFNTLTGTPGVGGAFFQLPEGSLVYEGTGKMEITATWTDPTITGAGLRYRTPASEQFTPATALTSASPLAIDISPEMTDMPHDKESRWMFLLVPAQPGQVIVGTIHMRIDIIRMRDVSLFPGHPELFHGEHTLTLYEGAATSTSQNFAARFLSFVTDNEQESGVRSQKVVPMETLSMTANVTITAATSNIGSVRDVDFLYKPAGSFRFFRAEVLSEDPANGVYQFGLPVTMRQTDSPYAKTSQWAFDLLIHSETLDGLPARGLADAEVDYDLVVVAYDSLLEGIAPLEDN